MDTITDVDALLARIREFRRARGWSINRLSREAGVPWSVLQDMDGEGWSPSLKTLRSIGEAMRRADEGRDRGAAA